MKQFVIENPVINSPFDNLQRHFRFSNEGITNEVVPERLSLTDEDAQALAVVVLEK
jgi:type III restriction enzyme